MWIFVATRARKVIPTIDDRGSRLQLGTFFVAIAAGGGDVSACEWELRFLVSGQREGGWFVPFQVVTFVATVEIRRRGELCALPVAVAVSALLEFVCEQ